MGIFSTKKKTYVASSVYSLAGDASQRPDFVKTLVSQNLIHGGKPLAEALMDGIGRGPMMQQRQVFRWCQRTYPDYVPSGNLDATHVPGYIDLTPFLPAPDMGQNNTAPPGAVLPSDPKNYILSSSIAPADFELWARDYVMQTYPDRIGEAWGADLLDTGEITIAFPDGFSATFMPVGFDPAQIYLTVFYYSGQDYYDERGYRQRTNGAPAKFSYAIGSGIYPELDKLLGTSGFDNEFFPVLPMRDNNVSARDKQYFDDVAKIYKRMTNGDVNDLLDSIEANDNLGDIDYCFMTYAVPLNAQRDQQKRYLYEFFRSLIAHQKFTTLEYETWLSNFNGDGTLSAEADAAFKTFVEQTGNTDPEITTLRMTGGGSGASAYDIRLHWVNISETTGTGLGKPDAVPGDLWFGPVTTSPYLNMLTELRVSLSDSDKNAFSLFGGGLSEVETVALYWQVSATRYRKLTINGMMHENRVYRDKSVFIKMSEALADAEDSGFILPLHYPTLQRLPATVGTQVCSESGILVFNSYKVVKTKWYQRGFFRIFLVVAVIVIAAIVMPATVGAMPGVLGTNAAVGAGLGLSGTAAIAVGAAVNAIAGMILMTTLQAASTAIFGEEWGAIIGAIASVIAMQAASTYFATGSLGLNWGSLMRVDNIMKLTEVGGRAYSAWANAKIGEMSDQLGKLQDDFEQQSGDIQDLAENILGYSGVVFDPLQFGAALMDTPNATNSAPISESRDTFLTRTLMTGTDVVNLSHSMIEEFVPLTLDLPSAIS